MEQNNSQNTYEMASEPVQPEGEMMSQDHDPLDEIITKEDAITLMQQEMRSWPHQEREVFESYYVEGMEPAEIGMVTGYPLNLVEDSLSSVRAKLHELYVAS